MSSKFRFRPVALVIGPAFFSRVPSRMYQYIQTGEHHELLCSTRQVMRWCAWKHARSRRHSRQCATRPTRTMPGASPNCCAPAGEIDIDGHISRCGDRDVRCTLYTAANALLTRSSKWSPLKAWGMKLAKTRGHRRAVILHRMWLDDVPFR